MVDLEAVRLDLKGLPAEEIPSLRSVLAKGWQFFVPLIAVIGLMVYGEAIDAWVLIGAGVIFGANYLNLWVETRKRY